MQTINDYDKDIFNGDLGFVHAVDPEAQELVLNFDGRLVNYDFDELDEIIPAYAISIHKSEGSEYPAVVIPFSRPSTTRCYGAISFIRGLRGSNGWWCWWGREKH